MLALDPALQEKLIAMSNAARGNDSDNENKDDDDWSSGGYLKKYLKYKYKYLHP